MYRGESLDKRPVLASAGGREGGFMSVSVRGSGTDGEGTRLEEELTNA